MSMDDPFGGLDNNAETPKEDTMTKTADGATAALKYFAAKMALSEDDYEEPKPYVPYIKPAERTWIAVEITGVKVETRESRLVVAYDSNGELVTDPDQIDEIVENGGEEVIEEGIAYSQFRLEVGHLGTHFGERNSPYLMFVPVFPQKVPYKEPRKIRGTNDYALGFKKDAGRKLLAATRVGIGRSVTDDATVLAEVAQDLIGKRVMVQVNRRESTKPTTKPRLNADGSFVKAKVDETEGSFVRLLKQDDGTFAHKNTGEVFEGMTANLIPMDGGKEYLIPDNSDFGQVVRETTSTTNTFDNLYDDTFRVPNVVMVAKQVTKEIAARFEVVDRTDGKKEVSRYVEIVRANGDEVTGQITWESIGFVATAKRDPGTALQATIKGDDGDKVITASWLGTHWEETPQKHELVVTEDGKPRLVPVAGGAGGLDTFKG